MGTSPWVPLVLSKLYYPRSCLPDGILDWALRGSAKAPAGMTLDGVGAPSSKMWYTLNQQQP